MNAKPFQALLRRVWPIALIVSAMVALRVVILAAGAVPFNSDEAVVGLMARHVLQGERPVFFYGQAYLGSTDAWLVAIGFSVFGQSVWVIRAVQVALFAATLLTTYAVARRLGLDEWTAHLSVALMALPPAMLTLYTTATLGGYGETLLFGNLLILTALSLHTKRPASNLQPPTSNHQLPNWLILGLLSGFAFYTFGLILVYLIPITLWLLWRYRLRAWQGYAVALAGFVIGSAPWWLSAAQLGTSLFAELTGSAVAGSVAVSSPFGSLGVRLINFFIFGLSAWLGLRYPWSSEWVLPVVGIVVLGIYLGALVYAVRRGHRLLWGMIATLLITYLVTSFGGDPSGRYFVPLYLPLSIFTAMALARLRTASNRPSLRWLAGLCVALIIVYNVSGTALAAVRTPPGITTQFDSVTWIDKQRDVELIEFLSSHGETRGYTNYWVVYPIAFLSGERIISSARLPYHLDLSYTRRDDRYPPYTQAVAESPRVFYITTNHPRLDVLIRDRLSAHGVTFDEHTIGNYHIFYNLSRTIEPAEIGLGDTTSDEPPALSP